jgi:hypothetical protein
MNHSARAKECRRRHDGGRGDSADFNIFHENFGALTNSQAGFMPQYAARTSEADDDFDSRRRKRGGDSSGRGKRGLARRGDRHALSARHPALHLLGRRVAALLLRSLIPSRALAWRARPGRQAPYKQRKFPLGIRVARWPVFLKHQSSCWPPQTHRPKPLRCWFGPQPPSANAGATAEDRAAEIITIPITLIESFLIVASRF